MLNVKTSVVDVASVWKEGATIDKWLQSSSGRLVAESKKFLEMVEGSAEIHRVASQSGQLIAAVMSADAEEAALLSDSGTLGRVLGVFVDIGVETLCELDLWGYHGNLASLLAKVTGLLDLKRMQGLYDIKIVRFLLQILESATPISLSDDTAPSRSRILIMAAMILNHIACHERMHPLLRAAGVHERLRQFFERKEKDSNGRNLAGMCAMAVAMLIGRTEDEKECLSEDHVGSIVQTALDILDPNGSHTGSSSREVLASIHNMSISDRHLRIMLDVGVLRIFYMVDNYWHKSTKEPKCVQISPLLP